MKHVFWLFHIAMISLALNALLKIFQGNGFSPVASYVWSAVITFPLLVGQSIYFRLDYKEEMESERVKLKSLDE